MSASKLSKVVSIETACVTFTVAGVGEVSGCLNDFPQEIVHQLALHGLSQKVGDAAASKDIQGETALAVMQTVVDNLREGKWGKVRTAGTSKDAALYVEAVARLRKITVAEAAGLIDGLDEDQVKALRKVSAVQDMVALIKAERIKAKGTAEAGGLDAIFG